MLVAGCYVANWPTIHQIALGSLSHIWSLSVEEQFYLIWPVILCGMLRLKFSTRTMLLVVCAGILASAMWRLALFRQRPDEGPERLAAVARVFSGLDTRADSLLCGCLVGLVATGGLLPKSRFWRRANHAGAIVSTLGLAYIVLHYHIWHHHVPCGVFTLVALLIAVILVRLLSASSRLAPPLLESAALVGVGRISYGLYLFHFPMIDWLQPKALGWTAPVDTLLVGGASLAAAIGSYYAIERPCLRWKARLKLPAADLPTCAAPPTVLHELARAA
jgi:peptidoglycan/LPS O-acetylase OafA/YrhL